MTEETFVRKIMLNEIQNKIKERSFRWKNGTTNDHDSCIDVIPVDVVLEIIKNYI